MDATQITITTHSPAAVADESPVRKPRRVSAIDLVAATPWAIEPAMLDTIRAIALREGEGIEALEAKLGRPLQNTRSVTMRGNVAVVPITGPIFRYANLFTMISGATSLDGLAKDFTTALEDPAVASIILDINSPGGQVTGIADFAAMIHGASKPVVAFVDGMAASAAYWIAAAASKVVMGKSAMAGNVGAVLTLDVRKDPNKVDIVSSQSPNKRPDVTTDAGRAQMQAMVDAQAQVFIEDVAAYRGISPEAVMADWGGGAVHIASQAVALGLADQVSTLEEVIAGLAGKPQSKPANPLSFKGTAMNLEELRAAHPDLCASLVAEGRESGAAAERDRIIAVESQAMPGHEALIAALKFDGKTAGPEAAVQVLAAERAKLAAMGKHLAADAPKPVPHAEAPAAESEAADPNDRAKLHAKAKEYQAAHPGTDYLPALKAVLAA